MITTGFITAFGCHRLRNVWICVLGKKAFQRAPARLRGLFTSGLDHKPLARLRYKTSWIHFPHVFLWLVLPLMMFVSLGCGLSPSLPTQATALDDMEVSRARFDMPQDEEQREQLPLGVFTGVHVGDSRQTLEARLQAPEGVLVTAVVENSPAVAAGLQAGDILLDATLDQQTPVALSWPSDWYALEQKATPQSTIALRYDRAGRDRQTTLHPVPRIKPPERLPGQRYREEAKVGVIVRNASEVEAHQAGLTRGEGCVVVGLARTSPWRRAGLLFGDLIVSLNGNLIKNPQALLAAINNLKRGDDVTLVVFRGGQHVTLKTTVSRKERQTTGINLPFLFYYENRRGIEKTSLLLGLLQVRKTAVASQVTLLWLIHYTAGDANRLEEIKS